MPIGIVFSTLGDSGWSNTQTLILGNATQPSTTPTSTYPPIEQTPQPTTTPTNPPNPITPDVNGNINPTAATSPSTQYPTATPIQANTQSSVVSVIGWEQVVIAAMAVVIAVLAVGLVALWRRVNAKM